MITHLLSRASNEVTSPSDPYAAVDPELIVGPMLIGLVLNILLYGMQLMQVGTYFRSSSRDSKWIKGLVLFLLLADTANSVFDVWFVYDYCVTKFGDKAAIVRATWVLSTDPVMTVFSSSTVQGFFAWRVHKLTGQTWLAFLICFFAFGQFCAALTATIGTAFVKEFSKFHELNGAVITWLVLAPVADIAISASLVRFLHRSKTGIAATDDVVGRITRLTIQTGAITAVWASVDLIIFMCWTNNVHLVFNMPLAKLYSNCLMSSLNARRHWSGSNYSSGDTSGRRKDGRGGVINITTETDTVVHDSYELGARGRPLNATVTIGGTGNHVKRKAMNDGLSLRSDSLGGGEADSEDVEVLDHREKLSDEELACSPVDATSQRLEFEFPAPPAATLPRSLVVQPNLDADDGYMPNQRHPYVNVSSPTDTTWAR